jgi:hypothetical protein
MNGLELFNYKIQENPQDNVTVRRLTNLNGMRNSEVYDVSCEMYSLFNHWDIPITAKPRKVCEYLFMKLHYDMYPVRDLTKSMFSRWMRR